MKQKYGVKQQVGRVREVGSATERWALPRGRASLKTANGFQKPLGRETTSVPECEEPGPWSLCKGSLLASLQTRLSEGRRQILSALTNDPSLHSLPSAALP